MSALLISELTETTVAGNGAFDTLMKAVKAHLEAELLKGSIKGTDYATVYLGSLELAMNAAMSFLMQKRKNDLEAQLLEKQILIADQQLVNLAAEKLATDAKTALTQQQTANAVTENTVLIAQECKLRAEFDLTQAQTTKSNGEIALLAQKTVTERAQTIELGVDANSVIGRQKDLYAAQTAGFTRDAEQKAAKLLVDSWSVRRTTDEATVADGTNQLNDATVGRAVAKLLSGVGA